MFRSLGGTTASRLAAAAGSGASSPAVVGASHDENQLQSFHLTDNEM